MDADEIVAAFDLDRVTHAAAAFDHAKLDWMNGEWIRRITLPELEARALPLARTAYGEALDVSTLRDALRIGQERAVKVSDIVEQADFLFVGDDAFAIAPESWERVEKTERIGEVLDALLAHLETAEWTVDGVDPRGVIDGLGLKARKVMPALYACLEGRHAGLPLFDSMVILGRERTLARFRAARERLGG